MNGKTIWWAIYIGLALGAVYVWGQYQNNAGAQKQSLAFVQAISTEGVPWVEINPKERIETTNLTPFLAEPEPEGMLASDFLGAAGMYAVRRAAAEQSHFEFARSTLETDLGTEEVDLLLIKGPGNPYIYVYVHFLQ